MDEPMQQETNQRSSLKPFWYVAAVVFVLLFVYGFMTRTRSTTTVPQSGQNNKQGSINLNTQMSQGGSYTLSQTGSATGQMRTLELMINTGSQKMTDADVILQYPQDALTVGKINPTDPEISVFQKEPVPGVVALTLVTSFNNKTGKMLGDKAILRIPVTIKTAGTHTVNLIPSYKNLKSKWVNVEGTLQVPQLTGGGVILTSP